MDDTALGKPATSENIARVSGSGPADISDRRRWTIIGLLFAASLLNYLDRATISFALPLISVDLHLTAATKGLLLSSFFWSYALMQIPIGWCVDRFDLRWLYAATFAIWSLAQGLTGFAESLAVLIGFRIVLGIGESVYLPAGTKIVSVLFANKARGLPSGLFDFGTRTGLVLEGILIPWLLLRVGWRHTFGIVGFAALLWLIPWLLIFPSRRRLKSGTAAAQAAGSSQAWFNGGSRWNAVTKRNLAGICLGFFCFDYYWYVLVTWLPDYLVTIRHLSIVRGGLYSSLAFCTFGITEPLGGWIADYLIGRGWDETRTRKGIVTFAFLTGLFLIAAIRVGSTGLAVGLLIGSCLVGLATGNLLVILQSCAPPDQVGIWTGAQNFFGNLAGIVAPLAIGLLIKWTGSYVPGFALGSLVLLVGLFGYGVLVSDLK
jgi:MFS transporter, ACS family, D-galactonate transporter